MPLAQATTTIDYDHAYSEINSDTTWTSEEGPYVIDHFLDVNSGTTLTIESGTEVVFNEFPIQLSGSLVAHGSEGAPVTFSAVDKSHPFVDPGIEANFSDIDFQNVTTSGDFNIRGDSLSIRVASSTFQGSEGNTAVDLGGVITMDFKNVRINKYDTAMSIDGTLNTGSTIQGSVIADNNIGIQFAKPFSVFSSETTQSSLPYSLTISQSSFYNNSEYAVLLSGGDGNRQRIDARNNWWGDEDGPKHATNQSTGGDRIKGDTFFLTFKPWLGYNPKDESVEEPSSHSSVVFIPGFQGSRLHEYGSGINPNDLDQRWEPNFYTDIPQLNLKENGESINDIRVGEPIDDIHTFFGSVYGSFMDFLDELKEGGSIEGWRALPYDWRKAQDAVVKEDVKYLEEGTYSMVERVKNLAKNSDTGKVTIIGHSNGGLIGKLLISELKKQGKSDLVDKFIMIGTPQIGTPKGIPGVLNGEGQERLSGWVVDKTDAVDLARNMPGAYSLIPSQAYMDTVSQPPVIFDDSVGLYTDAYGDTVNNYGELTDFLLGAEGRGEPESTQEPIRANELVLAQSQAVQDTLDDWMAPDNVEITEIIGWGMETIEGTLYSVSNDMDCDENYLAGTMECERFRRFGYDT